MAKNGTATVRLARDYQELMKDPLPNMRAAPSGDNIHLWYYIFVGNEGSPFAGGYYYGTIKFPTDYPFKPPAYAMLHDNGRFRVGQEICVTNSAYHAESWNPLWTVSGILTGFVAFFHDCQQVGFVGAAPQQKKTEYEKHAKASKSHVLASKQISELFPDVIEQIQKEMNGAKPKHSLPFPPEHYKIKEKAKREADNLTAEKNSQQDFGLMFDSAPEDTSDEE